MELTHLHPLLVHFPVALIIVGFLFDVVSLFCKKEACLSKAGLYLMVLGTLGAVAAFLAGEFFTPELTGDLGKLKEKHEIFAKITMYVMIAASVIRLAVLYYKKTESWYKWLVFVLFLIGTVGVGITGYLGGSIVYD